MSGDVVAVSEQRVRLRLAEQTDLCSRSVTVNMHEQTILMLLPSY